MYSLWVWLEARVVDFPVHHRHGVGARMSGACLDILEELARAAYAPAPSRIEALQRANARLAVLRLVLRGCRKLRLLSIPQHEHAWRGCTEVGRMIGRWLAVARKA